MQVRVVASAMRTAGVSEPLTLAQAKSWRAMTVEPPAWMIALLVDAATRRSRREHRRATQRRRSRQAGRAVGSVDTEPEPGRDDACVSVRSALFPAGRVTV
ncbi:hypothetical protein UK82_17285 [Frankia sp. ACN1ag]|nr:hypothetical protein UK82_17285 [Frankia sp. ACN1ag]